VIVEPAMGHGPLQRLFIMLRGEVRVLAGVLLKLGAALLVVQMLMWVQSVMPEARTPSLLAMAGNGEKPAGVATLPRPIAGQMRTVR
jgi:hypothetical protein